MPGISDTAYPRLKPNPSAKELDEVYTPNLFEGAGSNNGRESRSRGQDYSAC